MMSLRNSHNAYVKQFNGKDTANGEIKTFFLKKADKKQIVEKIREVLSQERHILVAFLYGSFLEDGPFRDIDIGIVVGKESPSGLYEFELEDKLSKTLSTHIPLDIRIINKAPVTFSYHVVTGELIFCRDENVYADFVTKVVREFLDIKPIIEHYTKEAYSESS